jgi:hypothetical protein
MIGIVAACLLIVVLSAREVGRAAGVPVQRLSLIAYPLLLVVVVAIGLRLADYL